MILRNALLAGAVCFLVLATSNAHSGDHDVEEEPATGWDSNHLKCDKEDGVQADETCRIEPGIGEDEHMRWEYITTVGGYPQGPTPYKKSDGWIDSDGDVFPVLVYIYYGVWYFLIGGHYMMKSSGNSVSGSTSVLKDGELLTTGYKDTGFGKFLFYLYHSYTFVFIIVYILLIFDTYWKCEFEGPDNLCFKGQKPLTGTGTYPVKFSGSDKETVVDAFGNETEVSLNNKNEFPPSINAILFFWCWCTGVSWAIFNYLYGGKVNNHFRTQCRFGEATHVLCRQKGTTVVMSNPNRWVRLARRASAYFASDETTQQYHEGTSEVVTARNGAKSFIFMCAQYAFANEKFDLAKVDLDLSYQALRASKGLARAEQVQRQTTLGKNTIPFATDSFMKLLGKELSSYLYIYQLTFFLVWLWFGGLIWCSPQMVVVVVCATLSINIAKENQEKIQKIGESGMDSQCTVMSDGAWVSKAAADLVPGDLLTLDQSNWTLPCDLVVVSGTCICDESGLTGESMPVRKSEVPTTPGSYDIARDEKHSLFAGTTLLQADSEGSLAVVTQTGIRTAKGDLVSAILYPASMVFEYDEELKIVFSLLSVYAGFLFVISIWLQWKISPMNWVSIFAFACFTISQILPPLLPVSLVIGHTKSANRLKTKDILCVEPKRIAISGKIHSFMFDKTGTLTKQGLDFIGIHRAANASFTPGGHQAYSAQEAQSGDLMTWAIATAHAVTYLRDKASGAMRAVGNQVEVQMFSGSGWTLQEGGSGGVSTVTSSLTGETLTIEKRFEFDHHSMTMSVVVRDQSGQCHVFCKGAPERVGALCEPKSLPGNFEQVSSAHAMEGCYVIGMSHKAIGNLSAAQISQYQRSEAESAGSLAFTGLLLFRNELKSDTKQAIQAIKAGDVRPVMVTGDNAHCGYYIAKQCEIVENQQIFLSDSKIVGNTVTWSDMAVGGTEKGISTQAMLQKCAQSDGKVECAITGKAMKALTATNMIHQFLLHTRIFARVQPDQKVQVITMYIDRGFITGMCGDGGNDCGALRSAHCGIALSDAEASVVSPFTSKTKSVQSVVDVLCEGRCALVTSFAAYRFYVTYGLNWSIVKTINFAYGVRMPIPAYLTIDSICSWLCAWAITGALPLDKLLKYRPTSSLFSPNMFLSVCLPWVMNMTLMSIFLREINEVHDDHVTMQPHLTRGVGYWELGDTWESTIFTFFQVCPLIFCGVCYSLGTKFRKGLTTNKPVLAVWGVIFIIYTIVLLAPAGKFTSFFHSASNAHNGFETGSPVWMRYQFPRGCPTIPADKVKEWGNYTNAHGTYNSMTPEQETEYIRLTGLGSWREHLPANCDTILASVKKCGPPCEEQDGPGVVTPGMQLKTRGTLYLFIVIGMVFMMGVEMWLNGKYINESEFMKDGSVEQAEVDGFNGAGNGQAIMEMQVYTSTLETQNAQLKAQLARLEQGGESAGGASYLEVGPEDHATNGMPNTVKVSAV